jgi:hypothetical protein
MSDRAADPGATGCPSQTARLLIPGAILAALVAAAGFAIRSSATKSASAADSTAACDDRYARDRLALLVDDPRRRPPCGLERDAPVARSRHHAPTNEGQESGFAARLADAKAELGRREIGVPPHPPAAQGGAPPRPQVVTNWNGQTWTSRFRW